MIPRYYDGTTGLTGNGIGALRDAISCTVTEERNGSYELEMEYPVDGLHYESLAMRGLIKAKPNPYSEEQLFRIYKITRPLDGKVTVCAQHISYDLSGVPVQPCTASSASVALETLKSSAAEDCPFNFWTDLQTRANFAVNKPVSLRSVLGGVDGSVLDVYGGEYEWNNYTVKLHAKRGTDRGVTVRYGKNLTDIKQEESCARVYTGVYPYWVDNDGNVTQISGDPVVSVPDGSYDFTRILVLDVSQDFEGQPTDDQLKGRALSYIKANKVGVPKVSLTLSYAQLEQTVEYRGMALLERVGLCDNVRVIFDRLGVDAESEVIKTIYNVLLDRYESIELGDARSTLADTVTNISKDTETKINKSATMLQQAIDKATQQITGNMGGHVVIHSSTGSDEPDEILIMDKPDINTATRVWRWNLSGWGYSSTGYAGPYRLAATMDGAINADFITTGSLTANIIKTGLLQDHAGKSSINLDTGEINLSCKTLRIQGKTTEEIAEGKANEAGVAAKEAASAELNAYKEAVTKDLGNMQAQIDGQIETWFYEAEPTTTTPPASDWTTEELKENHAGDLYYSGKGYAYRWTYSDNAWGWLQIKDTDITSALRNARSAQEMANSKRRTFLSQPVPPYDIGDLWVNGTDLLACVNSRGEGASYDAGDWEIKTDYTTKKTAQLIVDASIEKIELGIAEDVSAKDFFSTAAWKAESGSYTATSGSVTIADDTATIVAPDSTETGKRRAVVIDVPASMLAATQGKRVALSLRYKVNAEISGNAVVVLWANYESGNESRRLVTLATTSQTTPAGDWTTATLNYTFKDETPTRVYLFAYLYAGTGSLSVELPTMSEATGKKSTISLTKDGTIISSLALDLSKYATGTELKVGLEEISASVVKNGEIRSKFALDSSSCTISAGTIKFTGNTLVVDSTNFNLKEDGTVSITGAFYSHGPSGDAIINNGQISLTALNADGNRYNTISLNYTAKAYPSGLLTVYSRRADGTVGNGIVMQGGDADSRIWIYNAYGNADVFLTSGVGNNCEFAGGINVKGENGVNVTRAVSARDLKWWGDLMATGAQTRIKPRGGQNALYTDWQYWKTVNGESYWALVGKGTPW